MKERIVSGMRPTGKLHFGHYLGVIQNWVNLQHNYDCYFFVADWHALTTKYDKTETLREDVIDVVIDWLSCGLDPNLCTIYVQSLVPEIAELNVYLGMITPQNWVERDPCLKDMAKILRTKDGAASQINYGLMGYPVLMSADIMMFNSTAVPVGKDQIAHIEITRDIARRFNKLYKEEFFNEPKPLLNNCSLICGLDGNKMGKSFHKDIKVLDVILYKGIYCKSYFDQLFDNQDINYIEASHLLNQTIEKVANDTHIPLKIGKTITSDVFDLYSDSEDVFKANFPGDDYLAVEMEAFGLFYIAKKLEREASCLMTVVDSFYDKRSLTSEEREKSLDQMITLALDAILL